MYINFLSLFYWQFDTHCGILYLLIALISQETTATRTVLENLQPSTQYMVGVTGVNSVGGGTISVHTVQTGKKKCLIAVGVISHVFLICSITSVVTKHYFYLLFQVNLTYYL